MMKRVLDLDNINQFLERFELLEERMESLQQTIIRLAISSLPNPKYPYWYMLVALGISEEKRIDLEFALFVLTDRLSGKKVIVNPNDEITDEMVNSENRIITLSKARRFSSELVSNTLPVWEESLSIISSILETPYEETIKKILSAMREQGMFKPLINHLFEENLVSTEDE